MLALFVKQDDTGGGSGTVLDMHSQQGKKGVRFEDPHWWTHLPALKPIGLTCLLAEMKLSEVLYLVGAISPLATSDLPPRRPAGCGLYHIVRIFTPDHVLPTNAFCTRVLLYEPICSITSADGSLKSHDAAPLSSMNATYMLQHSILVSVSKHDRSPCTDLLLAMDLHRPPKGGLRVFAYFDDHVSFSGEHALTNVLAVANAHATM